MKPDLQNLKEFQFIMKEKKKKPPVTKLHSYDLILREIFILFIYISHLNRNSNALHLMIFHLLILLVVYDELIYFIIH